MALTVSVALGTHNGADYLEQQLRSVLSQTVLPSEIIISDDASADATVELARSVLRGSPVRLTVLENAVALGVTKNFEQAILACSGELVALCDQDDVWMPDRLERATALFASRPSLALVHGDAALVDAAGSDLGATLFEALEVGPTQLAAIHAGCAFELFLRRNLVTGATTMVRRTLAEKAAPFPSAWVHDEWLAVVAATTAEVDVVEAPLIAYRQHGSNQIGVEKLGLFGKVRRMLEPGAARSARLLERAVQLAERFDGLDGVTDEQRRAVAEKLAHERVRSGLSRVRILRVVPVLAELRTGRYRRFGRGAADAVRDVLQGLNDAR